MKNHKCITEGCETTMSDGTPELCPSCQDDMETRYAALLLHTQTVVDENARLRDRLQTVWDEASPTGMHPHMKADELIDAIEGELNRRHVMLSNVGHHSRPDAPAVGS